MSLPIIRASEKNRYPKHMLLINFAYATTREKHTAEPAQSGTPPTPSRSCDQHCCLPYCLPTKLEGLSTKPPKNTLKTKLTSFCRNHRNRLSASLRTPNFEPGHTFLASERFQVVPFADGLRIAHSFGEFAQSLFA